MIEIEAMIVKYIEYEELVEIMLYLDDEILQNSYNINDN